MKILANLSNLMMPVLVFYSVAHGFASKKPVYDIFVRGVKDGLKTVCLQWNVDEICSFIFFDLLFFRRL